MTVTIQLLVSAAIVAAVLWAMWRTPARGDPLFPWAPALALLSAWSGLAAAAVSGALWLIVSPDAWVVVVFLILDPASIFAGTMVLWAYRHDDEPSPTIDMQRLQAKVGIALGLVAVALGYIFVMTHKSPFTAVGT